MGLSVGLSGGRGVLSIPILEPHRLALVSVGSGREILGLPGSLLRCQ